MGPVQPMGTGVLSRCKAVGDEVKDEWSYTSAIPICLYIVVRGNFTFFTFTCSLHLASLYHSKTTRLRPVC